MSRRRPALQALIVVTLLLAAIAVGASEQSERLYSRGLVDFHAGRYAEASALFDQAVQTDEHDAYARYYRGVTRGRLGDFHAAADDLRAVVAMKPDLSQAWLELGVALVETGEYRDATTWLGRAQGSSELDARASLFLGIAQLRLGDTASAHANFERAAARDPNLAPSARYYEGIVEYRERDWSKAEANFDYVSRVTPDSEIGREARGFLSRLRTTAQPTTQLYGEVGFQYDSNVVLAPSDEVVKDAAGISRQSDGRVVALVGGTYVPWRTERAQLSVGYEFYQSLHFELHDFNLQDHRPSAEFTYDASTFRLGVLGRYDYYLLETDSLLQDATFWPWLEVPTGKIGRAEVYYRMRRRDYFKQPFNGFLDAFDHAAGIRQYVYLDTPQRYLVAGYQFDRDDPINGAGNQFAYDGNQVEAGAGWQLPDSLAVSALRGVTIEGDYAFRHERYATQSDGRRDEIHQLIFAVDKPLSDHLSIDVAYLGTFDNSNDARYGYDRSIVSVTLGVRF